MTRRTLFSIVAAILISMPFVSASGPVGIYGVIEKVVLEPNESQPDRAQVWGAFAYVDGGTQSGLGVSPVARGYFYFMIPDRPTAPGGTDPAVNVRREWADLKAVAGTGQAVGFGSWGYSGGFGALKPDAPKSNPPHIFERSARGSTVSDLRVRPASEKPGTPALYQTNAGVVKLSESSHQAIISQLRAALKP